MNSHDSPARARRIVAAFVALSALVLAGCSSDGGETDTGARGAKPAVASETPKSAATISTSVDKVDGSVPVDHALEVTAADGKLDSVKVRTGGKRVDGDLSSDDSSWSATDRLEPGRRYRVSAVAVDDQGLRTTERSSFRTEKLSLDRQTYPSIAPLQGETVGVGMPVIVQFDVPVTDKASIERHLSVKSTPKQAGSWHWISSQEVHWRPQTYWKPGSKVTVDADINSIPAGDGVYGQMSRSVSFDVGDSIVSKVD
ncbi:MAG TPA: Ig-like domain-containing protein, partial [Nocardioidaceae bacterium]